MRSVDAFTLTRKAHSATKVYDVDQVLSSCNYESSSRISCASASCYSSRAKVRNSRHLNPLSDEVLEHSKSTDNSSKKIFLYASQILEKLKKVNRHFSDSFNVSGDANNIVHTSNFPNDRKLNVSLRKVNFYYDLLKRLLEERCVLLLKEESHSCVKQTQKLVSDLKILYTNEILKLTTMPIKSYNRFIDSSGISITILEQLFRKVNFICDLHSSLKNNYHNIISFFHVGFDMELNQLFLKINKFQNHLYSEMFYWTHKILEIFILKLCLADPDSLSPEFLHHVVEMCESFNLLFFDKKQMNYAKLTNSYYILFNAFLQSDYEAILLDFILQYLSHFEAKVAAEKIIQYLIHECKIQRQGAFKELNTEKDKREVCASSSNTSDYFSSSPTIVEVEIPHQTHASANGSYTLENVFISFIQRNQSLVLKYLYSIMCLDVSLSSKNRNESNEKHPDSSLVNKAWNVPQTGFKNKSYVCLEERYWNRFWDKVFKFSLKLMLEVPCHQYGNAAVGVFLFWPQSYHYVIFKTLKSASESRDVPAAGLSVVKRIFDTLLIQTIQESWDKNMSSALSTIHSQHFMPIPVTRNKARTKAGNSLCCCIESLGTNLFNEVVLSDHLCLQLFYPFQVTLDCFLYTTNTKTRASVSSSDIPTYLLITRSDCVHACKLLGESAENFTRFEHIRYSLSNSWKIHTSKQTELLAGHVSEVPSVMHRVVSEALRKTCMFKLKKKHWWMCNYDNTLQSGMFPFTDVSEVFHSITDIISHIDDVSNVLSSSTSAFANMLIQVLRGLRRSISLKKIEVIKDILSDFFKWLEELNIEESDREKLKDMRCLRKVLCVIRILESSVQAQRSFQSRNKIAPSLTDTTPEECMILTEEERIYWRTFHRNRFSLCY